MYYYFFDRIRHYYQMGQSPRKNAAHDTTFADGDVLKGSYHTLVA